MPNSKNTTWIVCHVIWRPTNRGTPDVTTCDGRAYRSEKYAMEKYYSIIDSFKERGYQIKDIETPEGKVYFGVQLINPSGGAYGVVYVDRNPVWG